MPKRGKGWKDHEGNYLVVCEGRDGYMLAWLCEDAVDISRGRSGHWRPGRLGGRAEGVDAE